ncbi:hypothetical protein [Streptosporangium jomthongense]|uniref:Secreted protein n=1 Tax=Streptosporangium jomthongense TaxID=1193683 RepID=A0ABV8FGV4_9ACTN
MALIAGTTVSVLSWMAARRSAAAAEKAVEAAEAMTAIERERRHRDNRPDISIKHTPILSGGAQMELLLTGPHGVEEVRVERLVIQDSEPWANPVIQSPTREELAVYVRGPYEFVGKLEEQKSGGRTVEPFTLIVGYPHKLLLKETSPPPNSKIPENIWRQDVHSLSLRVAVECVQEGYEPWRYVFPEVPMDKNLLPPVRSSGA